MLHSYKDTTNVMNSKSYIFLIASSQCNKMITTKKLLEQRKSIPLIYSFYEKLNKFPSNNNHLVLPREKLMIDL